MPIAPGINGYAPDLDQRLPYDPEKARALLAEVSYTDGFSVPLDRYARWTGESEAIAAMLREVGIKVDVVDKSDGELNQKIASHKTDFYTRSTGYGMLNSLQAFKLLYRSGASELSHSSSLTHGPHAATGGARSGRPPMPGTP